MTAPRKRIHLKIRRKIEAGAKLVGYLLVGADGYEVAYRLGKKQPRRTGRREIPEPHSAGNSQAGIWRITDHVCRECLGRLLERMDGPEAGLYQCSICAANTANEIESLCACGARTPDNKDLGLRCKPNPKRSREFPHEIVAVRIPINERAPAVYQNALPISR